MLQHAVFMEYLPAFLDAACVFCEFFSISTGKFYQKNTFMLKNNFFEQVCTEKFGSNSEYLRKYFYYKLLFGFSKLKNVWVTQNQQIRGENWVRSMRFWRIAGNEAAVRSYAPLRACLSIRKCQFLHLCFALGWT